MLPNNRLVIIGGNASPPNFTNFSDTSKNSEFVCGNPNPLSILKRPLLSS